MMSPAGGEHGRIAMRLGSLLEQHVRSNKLGTVYAAETGFLIAKNPDTVRAPDFAFVESEAVDRLEDVQGFLSVAPHLVGEVVSPNDTFTEIEAKTQAWLEAGVQAVLIVDPGTQSIQVYRREKQVNRYSGNDSCDLSDVVPAWQFELGEVFH